MAKINLPLQKVDYEKIHLVRGDCLAVKRPKGVDDYDWSIHLLKLGEDIANNVGISTVVFGVERKLSEIRRVSEQQMESYGWVRKDRVFAFKDEAHEVVAQKYEDLAKEYHAKMEEEE